MNPKLLIVDDDVDLRAQMRWALSDSYEVLLAGDRPEALDLFQKENPRVVILDLGLPPEANSTREGMTALNELLSLDPMIKVVVVTGQSDKENALQAIEQGAYDFLCKPVDTDDLLVILKRAVYLAQLERNFQKIQKQFAQNSFEGMLGTCPQIQNVFSAIAKVASSDAPVLILGESGTGKEMVALAIHRRSPRKDGPFVAINCGAIPENLLESELFGHEKGSFTGAHAQRSGRIEAAAAGTLFLDEIGELPVALQVKLLRFLQEQRIERVGGRKEIVVDARIVAATNVDLRKAMEQERFREDLYYRLAVVVVELPPLRERGDDIILIAKSFLQGYAAQKGVKHIKFSQDALRGLRQHSWPGNIRELDNRIKRAVIMAENNLVTLQDLELNSKNAAGGVFKLKEARENLEREMILEALRRNSGRISQAATDLGVSRPTLYDLMDKLGLQKPEE